MRGSSASPRPGLAGLALALYLCTLSVDAVRKVAGLPLTLLGAIYVITALIYVFGAPRVRQDPGFRRTLPLWLFLLSLWCLTVAFTERIPYEMALLGWASYVFFVPLAYAGAALAADDAMALKALRVVAICGAVVGASTIAGALLGDLAPALLRPIIPSVGIHTGVTGNVYLSPSIFASAEEAAEQLLISLFAWIALAYLDSGRFWRVSSAILGALIIAGLLFTARRADIYVAAAGTACVILLHYFHRPAAARPSKRRRHIGSPLAVFAVAVASVGLASLGAGGTVTSFLLSGSTGNRISLMFSLTSSGSLLGQGPGTSAQGISFLGGTPASAISRAYSIGTYFLNGRAFTSVEGGLAKTWLELGLIGVILYGAVFLSALSPSVRSIRRRDGMGTALTILVCALGVIFLKGHQSLDDPLIQPLFWLAVGGIWGRAQLRQPESADYLSRQRMRENP